MLSYTFGTEVKPGLCNRSYENSALWHLAKVNPSVAVGLPKVLPDIEEHLIGATK
jgi:hypothetical protein